LNRKNIKAIFWDNDGVLVDTERLFFSATRQILAKVGITLTKEMFIQFMLIQGKGAWHLAEEKGISPEAIVQLRKERDYLYADLLSREHTLIDGAVEVLEALSDRYVMGIVTSSKKAHFEIIHKSTGILKYFDFVLTGNDYIKFKPDPEPYLLAVEKSGFTKKECVAIEDSERGLISAKSAGICCIVIPSELTRGGDFSKADKVLGNIRELTGKL
jgi:HAD superfamily hydrolase (TIGR01509 family)